ncbi:hypothetical protein GO998_22725 (plasmid) [Ralstonia syzygii]|uniref:Uncharacterized protein n=1 Tax=Ralstonia syzygii TaxID=28097 RepID=A0ABX7ZMU9_9RALS|nr:hypothetical protein [Ralstonia syzygii]QUP56495.1 hypothetical protein GO998_22725 [Ralstonia syzygii]
MDITTANYNAFVTELSTLTRKYGVALTAIGGVCIADEPGAYRNVVHVADITSGDLYAELPES